VIVSEVPGSTSVSDIEALNPGASSEASAAWATGSPITELTAELPAQPPSASAPPASAALTTAELASHRVFIER
jgi:hypothetical protein